MNREVGSDYFECKTDKQMAHTQFVLNETWEEMKRQEEKWGIQTHDLRHYLSILTEEVGEFAKDANDLEFVTPNPMSYEEYSFKVTNARNELIQVSAVALSIAKNMDRKHPEILGGVAIVNQFMVGQEVDHPDSDT